MNILLCVLLAVVLPLALPVEGWWDTGHMLVAQIAWKYLNQTNPTSNVTIALQNALLNSVQSLVTWTEDSNTFVTAACWMDDEKQRGISQFSNWHYINLPICAYANSTNTDACNGISVDSVIASDDEDVLWAIEQAAITIKNTWALGFERGFALRNLLHLIGDIHQPLHAVARYSEQFPAGDQGGNKFLLQNVSLTNNLHGFWDSGLGLLNNSITRPLSPESASYLSQMADQIMNATASKLSPSLNYTLWAVESRNYAMTYAYNLTYNSVPSQEYIQAGWPVVEERIGVAGYRLYLVLQHFVLCDPKWGNCPTLAAPPPNPGNPENQTLFYIVVGLAVALGVSLITNFGLLYSRNRSRYSQIQ